MAIAAELARRLSEGEVVVLDGGTGTELQARGVPMDEATWCGVANLEHGDVVQSVHESYISAGADVIITNTFATGRPALESAGLGDRVEEANSKAVEAARRAREAVAERPVAIAGSMSSFCSITMHQGPFEGSKLDGFAATWEDPRRPNLASYREQAAILADAGVDLIALEMINSPGYGLAAIEAATETGLPVWLGISPVRLSDGSLGTYEELPGNRGSFEELVAALVHRGLAAVNVMHAKSGVVAEAIDIVRRHFDGPIGAYAESGDWTPPKWVFTDLSPEEYLAEALGWVALGAQLIGGCCGTGPTHVRALAAGLPRQVGH
jgi:homocysteine S-methyltransferase